MPEYPIGRLEDLPPGSHRVVRAGNRELGVFNIAGELHAIPNLCPHQRGPLCTGRSVGHDRLRAAHRLAARLDLGG